MVMRYYWGLAIGHTYAQGLQPIGLTNQDNTEIGFKEPETEPQARGSHQEQIPPQDLGDGSEWENPELGMEDNKGDVWLDDEDSEGSDGEGATEIDESEEFMLDEMYGASQYLNDDYK